ncbi:hypothetical protein C1N57_26270 (plasmid) [Priestia aryabhattai]
MKKWLWIMLSVGVITLVFMMNYFIDKSQQQPNIIRSVSLTTSTSPNQQNIVEVKRCINKPLIILIMSKNKRLILLECTTVNLEVLLTSIRSSKEFTLL